MPTRDQRFNDILRRLEQRKQAELRAPQEQLLGATLDELNAADQLEKLKRRPPASLTAYGPKTFSSRSGAIWVGSLLWHKPKGYGHYQSLGILGIWACVQGSDTEIILGEKSLAFSAPIFNPESYYHHIKRRFDLYYPLETAPPADPLYRVRYHSEQRLLIRSALEQQLAIWRNQPHLNPPPDVSWG
jgi:hypothetical protein